MKNRFAILTVLLLSFTTVNCVAQSNKSAKVPLFKTMPKTILCTSLELNQFFQLPKGQQKMQTFIADQFDISGTIISSSAKFSNLSSTTIKLSAYNDAILSISKRIDEKNNAVFTGHIIHQNSSDGYELKKNEDNTYQFVKINVDEILPTCAQF